MLKWIFRSLLALLALAALIAVGGYFALKRPDIGYDALSDKYGGAASLYADLPNGVRMHYRDEGNPNGPTLLLIHGFSASLHTWAPWVERLGSEYRIVSLDLPGHGLTSAPVDYQATIESLRDAVAAFAQANGLTRFALAGSSMGGNVAWEYALAHPQQVDALILVDASGWEETRADLNADPPIFRVLRDPVLGPLMRDLDNSALARQGLVNSFADPALVDDAMLDRYVELARAPGHRDILLQLTLGFRERNYATPERLAALAMPVLILHGAEDLLVPPVHARQFKSAIAQAELVMFEHTGHIPHEETPDASAEAVRQFLGQAAPALAADAR